MKGTQNSRISKRKPYEDLGYKCTDVGEPKCVEMPEGGEKGPFEDFQSCVAECEATFDVQKTWSVRSGNMDNYGERFKLQPAEDGCLFDREHEVMMTFAVPDGPRVEGFFTVSVEHFLGQMAHDLNLLRVVWTRKHDENQSTKTAEDLEHGGGFCPEDTSDAMFLKLDFSEEQGYRMILEDETLKKLRNCLTWYRKLPKSKQRGIVFSPFTLIRVRLGSGELEYRGDDAVHPQRPVAVPPDRPGTYRIGSSSGVFGISARHAAEPSEKIYRVHVDPRFFAEFEQDVSEDVSLLYLALRDKNKKVSSWLMEKGIDITSNETDEGVAALYLAIDGVDTDIVEWLIQSGVDVNKPFNTPDGETPLHFAVMSTFGDYTKCLEVLIDAGADVNHVDKMSGHTPLIAALKDMDDHIGRFLISRGADIDKCEDDIKGNSPLLIAGKRNCKNTMAVILNMGRNVNYMNQEGDTALFAAIEKGYHNMIEKLLIDHDADVNLRHKTNGNMALHLAAKAGEPWCLETLILEGASIHALNAFDGTTALHVAAKAGKLRCLEILIEEGADVNSVAFDGSTPLYVAAQNGETECLKMLIEKGGGVNPKSGIFPYGSTPLLIAIENSNTEVAKLLIDEGADVYIGNINRKRSPLTVAVIKGLHEIVALLLTKGSDVNYVVNASGDTALSLAINSGAKAMTKLLIKADADVNKVHKFDRSTPLTQAIKIERDDIVKQLLEQSTIIYDREGSIDGELGTPLYFAAMAGNLAILKMLLKHGGGVNPERFEMDCTDSMLVAQSHGHTQVVDFLIHDGRFLK